MNSQTHLESPDDGSIPAAELAAVRPPDRPAGTMDAMASQLVEIYRDRGEVVESDLLRYGFTRQDIEQHGQAARQVAAVKLGMRIGRA